MHSRPTVKQIEVDEFNTKSSALNAKSKALSSYVEINLEAEKERVLNTYRGR